MIDADSIGHEVLLPDGPAFDAVAARWPDAVNNGAIDRRRLARIVFTDAAELAELEAITHPHIAAEIQRRVERLGDRNVVVEIPLIRGIVDDDWHRLVVVAEDATRLVRLITRGMAEDDARNRMAMQPSVGDWLASADSVIWNATDRASLEASVDNWLVGVSG